MRLVQATDEGVVELAFMWLPTFIGMNAKKLQEVEEKLKDKLEAFKGKPFTEEVLDELHDLLLDFLEEEYRGIDGLRDYLDAIKYVQPGT
jgi:hypothetical protein